VDAFEPSTTLCRSAAGECDVDDFCPGTGPDCSADIKQPAGTACPDDGNSCSSDQCDGASDFCQHPAGNAGAVCRASAGTCDVAESCTGTSTVCPVDTFESSATTCRLSAGECDVAESCTGSGPDCPADVVAPAGTACTDDGNPCSSDQCDGTSATCPHGAANAGTECRAAAGACDVAESCNGTSPTCPADTFAAPMECRSSAGSCDVAEVCSGLSAACPPDVFQPATVLCRAPASTCDAAESCPGTGPACPPDVVTPAGTQCRAAVGTCDVAETCDGTSNTCPADAARPAGTLCRAAVDDCDIAETCNGTSTTCPADAAQPNGTPCDDTNVCTTPDTCQGGVCTGTPIVGCGDHFLCYKIKGRISPIFNVHLVDQFEDVTFDLRKVKQLCTPVDKNGEGVSDAVTHQQSYSLKALSGSPRFTRQIRINVTNQLGSLFVDAYKRDFLLVPSNKNLSGPATPPDNNAINVDHYKCYKVKVTSGTPRFTPTTVTVADQFTTTKTLALKKMKHLCTPVDKNGEGIKNPSIHLACYQAKPASGQPRHVRRTGVNVANQLGPLVVGTLMEREICVPSTKTLTP
jgi:hypothetical protein